MKYLCTFKSLFINQNPHLMKKLVFLAIIMAIFFNVKAQSVVTGPETWRIPACDTLVYSEQGIMEFFRPVLERELKLGHPTPDIDNGLWSFASSGIVQYLGYGHDEFVTAAYYCTADSFNLLKAPRFAGKFSIYSYSQALSVIRQAILTGKLDQSGTILVVNFIGSFGTQILKANRSRQRICISLSQGYCEKETFFYLVL